MKRRPVIRGQKTKSLRVDPKGLAEFREELKGNPEWAEYAEASESELVVLATMFARIYMLARSAGTSEGRPDGPSARIQSGTTSGPWRGRWAARRN